MQLNRTKEKSSSDVTRYSNILKLFFFGVHVTVHRDKFLIINKLYALISQIYFWIETLQDQDGNAFHPDPALKLSANLYDICIAVCTVKKLLMMDRGTVRNM